MRGHDPPRARDSRRPSHAGLGLHVQIRARGAGFVAAGVDVLLTGPLPTPAIAVLTKKLGADFGIVISASHNPHDDNGIKFFDADGEKLSDEIEEAIEAELDSPPVTRDSRALGQAKNTSSARTDYEDFCKSTIPAGMGFENFKIVVDASHGAAYEVAPRVMSDLGADVVPVGCSPNGRNINDGCGSTRPDLLKLTVTGVRAHVGLALDGDGDRVVMVDERGNLVDGDQLVYILARERSDTRVAARPRGRHRHEQPRARDRTAQTRPRLPQGAVGDRNVLAMLKAKGRHSRRRDLGPRHLPRSHHDRRRLDHGAAGARRHAANGARIERLGVGHGALSAGAAERQSPGGPSTRLAIRPCGTPSTASNRSSATAAASYCVRREPSPCIRIMVEGEDAHQVNALAGRLAASVRSSFGTRPVTREDARCAVALRRSGP